MNIVCVGDAMIPGEDFKNACAEFSIQGNQVAVHDWERDWGQLQNRRLVIEQQGPDAEPVLPMIQSADSATEMLLLLFAPIAAGTMDALPNLRVIGAARAGLENIDVEAATERGILVHHIMGRNAHAVSDFAIGLLFAEARNIARAHKAIHAGTWRKTFVNSDVIPEISGKTLGLVGFGYIGQLVAKKLSGFALDVLVYDPFVPDEVITAHKARRVSKEALFQQADFVSVHARLTGQTTGMIGNAEFALMKPTALFINTARAGLIDEDALYQALENHRIAGAALDVFPTEPLPENSRWLRLDNVTLTSHLAGTTADALRNSPFLLVRDIDTLLTGGTPNFLVNPDVLDHPKTKEWLASLHA